MKKKHHNVVALKSGVVHRATRRRQMLCSSRHLGKDVTKIVGDYVLGAFKGKRKHSFKIPECLSISSLHAWGPWLVAEVLASTSNSFKILILDQKGVEKARYSLFDDFGVNRYLWLLDADILTCTDIGFSQRCCYHGVCDMMVISQEQAVIETTEHELYLVPDGKLIATKRVFTRNTIVYQEKTTLMAFSAEDGTFHCIAADIGDSDDCLEGPPCGVIFRHLGKTFCWNTCTRSFESSKPVFGQWFCKTSFFQNRCVWQDWKESGLSWTGCCCRTKSEDNWHFSLPCKRRERSNVATSVCQLATGEMVLLVHGKGVFVLDLCAKTAFQLPRLRHGISLIQAVPEGLWIAQHKNTCVCYV